jgi:ABC-type oligopeptide transport system substrate-binding subunit
VRKKLFALTLLLLAGPALAAPAADTLNRGNGAEPESLDPQFAGGVAEENILNDLMVGPSHSWHGGKLGGLARR